MSAWIERDQGELAWSASSLPLPCLDCGRPLYTVMGRGGLFCTGCGERNNGCICPRVPEVA